MRYIDYGSFIKELLVDTNATLLGEEKLSGTSCYVIEETPKKDMYIIGQKSGSIRSTGFQLESRPTLKVLNQVWSIQTFLSTPESAMVSLNFLRRLE